MNERLTKEKQPKPSFLEYCRTQKVEGDRLDPFSRCVPAQTEDENADKLKLNEYIDWLGIHAKRWGVRKAFLRYLNFTNTNDARRYQHFVKGGGTNLVINLLVARPTPEKNFPEVVPILRECGKCCAEGSPESMKNLIHITHAFEDQ